MPIAWVQRLAGPGLALDMNHVPYAIPHFREERVRLEPPVPVGAWRGVAATQNAFVVEGFIDELAHAVARDPFEFRCALLKHEPRGRAALELAATKASWNSPASRGRHRGIALYYGFGSWVAQVAEVSISDEQAVCVHRIVSAIDCGLAVNPDTLCAQLEGGIAMGLSAALKEEVAIAHGQVQQATFEDYPILTLAEMPQVEVHIVESRESPTGVGELGVLPVAPAVANAVFAATGQRLRTLPLSLGVKK